MVVVCAGWLAGGMVLKIYGAEESFVSLSLVSLALILSQMGADVDDVIHVEFCR